LFLAPPIPARLPQRHLNMPARNEIERQTDRAEQIGRCAASMDVSSCFLPGGVLAPWASAHIVRTLSDIVERECTFLAKK